LLEISVLLKMNMMKYFFIASCVLFFSCKKATTNDTCSSTINSGILTVSGPSFSVAVNQDINFEVSYGVANGCGVSSDMEIIKDGNIVKINMLTKYEGCICTQIYSEGRKNYTFKSAVVGNFKLKFSKGDNTFIEKNVIVQ
jgi:hypothetical protein